MKKVSKLGFLLILLPLMILSGKTSTFAASDETREVLDATQFTDAWNDQSVRHIILKNDINTKSTKKSMGDRTEDIEISGSKGSTTFGEYYSLYLDGGVNSYLGMGYPVDNKIKKMHIHDLKLENNGGGGRNAAIISDNTWTPGSSRTPGQYWELTFGNIDMPKNTTTYRVARATRGQINLYGKLNLITKGENFYTGGIHIAEGTEYYGELTNFNYSVIWFRASIQNGDAGSGDFIVEPNAKVKLRNTGSGTGFPSIYRNWQNIIIGENSEFTATVPGNAIGFGGTGKKFIAKKGSEVTLTSIKQESSISTWATGLGDIGSTIGADLPVDGEGSEFRMEPDSSLYVIGSTKGDGMIRWEKGGNNKFIIDNPRQFDIRNNNTESFLTLDGTNEFIVKNSNVDMWKKGSTITDISDITDDQVQNLSFINKNSKNNLQALSDNKELETKINTYVANSKKDQGSFRRLSGFNTNPVIEWQRYATDTEKKFDTLGRVRIGIVPDNEGLDKDGNLHFIKLYAKDKAKVTITDSESVYPEEIVNTNAQGYMSLKGNPTRSNFYPAGTIIKGQAQNRGLVGDEQILPPVVDLTPPEPVTIDNPLITSNKKITGKKSEPNSLVYMKKNNSSLKQVTVVKPDGTWEFLLDEFLEPTDTVRIYLEDKAGRAPNEIEDPYLTMMEKQVGNKFNIPLGFPMPITNNERGNINPDKQLKFIDSVFKEAPTYKVFDDLAQVPIIEKKVTSSTIDTIGKEWTEVGSRLTYKVMIKNIDKKMSQKKIKNAKFSDDIWSHKKITLDTGEVIISPVLEFDLEKSIWHIKKNGVTIDSTNMEGIKHLLSYKDVENQRNQINTYKRLEADLGDLEPEDEVEISYEVNVKRGAAGDKITNTAQIIGENSRKVILKNQATAVNPGGDVKGQLSLVSIPNDINFGTNIKLQDYQKIINVQRKDFGSNTSLTVEDTRAIRNNWTLAALVKENMTFQVEGNRPENPSLEHQLKNGFSYVYNGKELPLSLKETKIVFDSSEPANIVKPDKSNLFHLSDVWGKSFSTKAPLTEGLKFKSDVVPNEGTYRGAIEWQIQDTVK